MKSKIVALALLVGTTASASATVSWQGEVMITQVSAGCAGFGDVVGDDYLSNFMPQGVSDNGPTSWLSILNRRSAWSINFSSQSAAVAERRRSIAMSYTGTRIASRGNSRTGNGTIELTAKPNPNENQDTLSITAEISNWLGGTGCTVTIQGAFTKRVD